MIEFRYTKSERKKMNERLPQEHIIQTENTLKVVGMLRKHTGKKVLIKDIKELSDDPVFSGAEFYLGATYNGPESIIVYLNLYHPNTCEATFVHEILHIILEYEGFPEIIINQAIARTLPPQFSRVLPKLQSFFSSTIDHPEIFKRMESEFELNLSPYYEIQVQQKLNRFQKGLKTESEKNQQYYFFRQQDILIGLEYFFFPKNYKERVLQAFNRFYPDAYASCLSLYKRVRKVGFNSSKSSYQSAKMIKTHIIRYGERKKVGIFNRMWEALEVK
jgi:hypothetical protein